MGICVEKQLNARRGVFLDRDGVITVSLEMEGKGYAPRSLADFKFYDGTLDSIEGIRKLGFLPIIVSNQPDVANGLLADSVLEQMNQKIRDDLGIAEINNCPHNSMDNCSCRKPKPGMILSSAEKWSIDLPQSWMIGDRDSDVVAGATAGCKTIFIDRNWKAETGEYADFRCGSLRAAIDLISEQTDSY